MNKAAILGAIQQIKNLEEQSEDKGNHWMDREWSRREARRLRSVFGLIGIDLQ